MWNIDIYIHDEQSSEKWESLSFIQILGLVITLKTKLSFEFIYDTMQQNGMSDGDTSTIKHARSVFLKPQFLNIMFYVPKTKV